MKSCLFQRLALSTDKEGLLALANEGHQVLTPQDIIRDPFVLEFAGLPNQKRYKESDLEDALKTHMEQFLLELGKGFAFVGRQSTPKFSINSVSNSKQKRPPAIWKAFS